MMAMDTWGRTHTHTHAHTSADPHTSQTSKHTPRPLSIISPPALFVQPPCNRPLSLSSRFVSFLSFSLLDGPILPRPALSLSLHTRPHARPYHVPLFSFFIFIMSFFSLSLLCMEESNQLGGGGGCDTHTLTHSLTQPLLVVGLLNSLSLPLSLTHTLRPNISSSSSSSSSPAPSPRYPQIKNKIHTWCRNKYYYYHYYYEKG